MASDSSQRQIGRRGGNVLLDVYVLDQRIGALLDAVFADQGLTPAEYAVYSQLGIAALTPSELSARLGVRPSTLSGNLAALQRRGHTNKLPDPTDGRSHRLELTDSGHAFLESCRPLFRHALRRLHHHLDVEIADVRQMLAAVDAAAQDATADVRGARGSAGPTRS